MTNLFKNLKKYAILYKNDVYSEVFVTAGQTVTSFLRKEDAMKRYWKKITALMVAAAMTSASAITVFAEAAEEGKVYVLPTLQTSSASGQLETLGVNMQVVFSDSQLLAAPEAAGWAENQLPVVEGAEWKKVYMYRNKEASKNTEFSWDMAVENSTNWIKVAPFGIEEGKLTHLYDFTIIINGTPFTGCKLYGGAMGEYETSDGFSGEHCMFILVPQGYNGDITFSIYGNTLFGNSHVRNDFAKLTYQVSGHSRDEAERQAEEAKAVPVWKQDNKGWWLENPDGTYLKDVWYQSPESGLWYYMGGDGYMLTNTTTPDNLKVDANGVWVQ